MLFKRLLKATKKNPTAFLFGIFLILCLFFFRKVILSSGFLLDGELFTSTNYSFFLKHFLSAWGSYIGLGHSNIGFPEFFGNSFFFIAPTAFHVPWLVILSLLENLFGSYSLKIFVISGVIAPFLGMSIFARFWFKELKQKKILFSTLVFLTALIYTVNDIMGNRVFAGHNFYNYGFAILPVFVLFFIKAVLQKEKRALNLLILGFLAGILFWLMPHMLVVSAFPIGFYILCFAKINKNLIITFLTTSVFVILSCALLNIAAWLPALYFSEDYPALKNSVFLVSFLYNTSFISTFRYIVTLSSPFWKDLYSDNFRNLIYLVKLALPLLALFGIAVEKNRKSVFVTLLLFTGLILGMGVNYPFEDTYKFIYSNIPLFNIFRDASKFSILYVFGISISVPLFFVWLASRSQKLLYPSVVIFVALLIWSSPIYKSGNFLGALTTVKIPSTYIQLKDFLEADPDDFRFAVYPNNRQMSEYAWMPKTESGIYISSVFANFFPIDKEFGISGNVPTDYSSQYLAFIESNLGNENLIRRLGRDNYKYLIVDKSLPTANTISDLFSDNPSLEKTNQIEGFEIYKIKNYNQKKEFLGKPIYYYGNFNGLKDLPSDFISINLDRNPLNILSENYSKDIFLSNSKPSDIFFNSLKFYSVDLMKVARKNYNPSTSFLPVGYSSMYEIYEGIKTYNPNAIYTMGSSQISMKIDKVPGKYKVLVSLLNKKGLSDEISIQIGKDTRTKKMDGKKGAAGWIDMGEYVIDEKNSTLVLKNNKNLKLFVDFVLIVPSNKYESSLSRFNALIEDKNMVEDISQVTQEKRINFFPTTYSPYWRICDQKVLIAEFYGMASSCKKNKIKTEFAPENIYKLAFVLEGLTIIVYLGMMYKAKNIK